MALVAVAVTIGSPNAAGQVPVTTSNLASAIATAITDTTALQALITTHQADATAADTDVASSQTSAGTANSAAATSVSNATTADNNEGTNASDFDAFAALVIAITGDTYNSTTKQFTFGGATGLTHAQWAGAIGTAINALGANIVTTKASTATAKTQAVTTNTATTAVITSLAITKTATALSKTEALALSTSTVATDHTNAQAIISAANVFIQTDTGVCTNVALLNGALVTALTFTRDTAILPT